VDIQQPETSVKAAGTEGFTKAAEVLYFTRSIASKPAGGLETPLIEEFSDTRKFFSVVAKKGENVSPRIVRFCLKPSRVEKQ
jgi:hypothetical protein